MIIFSKRLKSTLLLLTGALIIFSYFLFNIKFIDNHNELISDIDSEPGIEYKENFINNTGVVDAVKEGESSINDSSLEIQYKKNFNYLFFKYLNFINEINITKLEDISDIKKGLLEIKVPAEFKNLHLEFFMMVEKTENYFYSGNKADLEEVKSFMEAVRLQYPWVNNSN